jgi:hypothetical protein
MTSSLASSQHDQHPAEVPDQTIPANTSQATTQRTVTFVSPSVSIPSTPRVQRHHQEDPFDPFIAHTEVFLFYLNLNLFSNIFYIEYTF